MNLSRRHLLSGGFAGLGVLGVSALTGCSTSTEPKSDTGAGDAKKLVLWMWPEGFDKQTLATVAKAQPSYNVRQDIIGGDFKQKLTTTFTAGSGLPDLTGVKGEDIAFFRDHALRMWSWSPMKVFFSSMNPLPDCGQIVPNKPAALRTR